MAKKKWEDMNTLERIVDATDVVKLYGGGIWGDKYDKWLDKSNTKASGFAGKFLRVSFWLSTIFTLLGLYLFFCKPSQHLACISMKEVAKNISFFFFSFQPFLPQQFKF